MKRRAFTLAEMLITLSIIGVVATLVLPTLNGNIKTAQIGPKLAKAAATFERANKAMLNDYDANRLSDIDLLGSDKEDSYIDELSKYMHIAKDEDYTAKMDEEIIKNNGVAVRSNTGAVFVISTVGYQPGTGANAANKDRASDIYIDIDGNKGPSKLAEDIFVFHLMDNGSLLPIGSSYLYDGHWKDQCPVGKEPIDPTYCGAHVFENNLRVLYKL
jgi:prepilin-type N-terminal cleavage/methylation domain-containing protein